MLPNGNIHVNQIGYASRSIKKCIVSGQGGSFEIIDARTGSVVLTNRLFGPKEDAASGDHVYYGDFSELIDEGTYYVHVPGYGISHTFVIASKPYKALKLGLLKSFYFQRCGMALEEVYAGVWKHDACHLADGTVYGEEGTRLPSAGGWHDAGDYGKYTVAAAKAIADLLLAYEWFPGVFQDRTGIPESGNGVPDVLNEVRVEIEWLFKMQRPVDGGVFHKLTTNHFPGLDVIPEHDLAELVFSPVSAAATADYAAVMAMAARVYRRFDERFASSCLTAAQRAWNWIQSNRPWTGFRNPAGITTGEYGDETVTDEVFWAAAEMYRTTNIDSYHMEFKALFEQGGFQLLPLGWGDVGGYGTLAYLSVAEERRDPEVSAHLYQAWLERAEQLLDVRCSDGYLISLTQEDYIWGSMMVLMNQAMHLIIAGRFADDKRFEEAALDHLHYLLGRNPLDQSYVTGFGGNPVRHPHHRPSVGDGVIEPVPGMVAGGPNVNLQDPCAKSRLEGNPPARCFIDHQDSYATNEMTIYWNSPAVFVAACFDQES